MATIDAKTAREISGKVRAVKDAERERKDINLDLQHFEREFKSTTEKIDAGIEKELERGSFDCRLSLPIFNLQPKESPAFRRGWLTQAVAPGSGDDMWVLWN